MTPAKTPCHHHHDHDHDEEINDDNNNFFGTDKYNLEFEIYKKFQFYFPYNNFDVIMENQRKKQLVRRKVKRTISTREHSYRHSNDRIDREKIPSITLSTSNIE